MSAKRKTFIVLCVGDRDGYGYDEHTLPLLVQLIDASDPDARMFTHQGVIGYYLWSRRALTLVEQSVFKAEQLRDSEKRLATLGIGVAHGEMLADFDWVGRLKGDFTPVGVIANHASAGVRGLQTYRDTLRALHESLG